LPATTPSSATTHGVWAATPPAEDFSDVADLAAVLDHFTVPRAALVGLSMGGETALDFALARPHQVSALALIGSSVSGHVWPETAELSAYREARRHRDAERLAELELEIWAAMGAGAPGWDLITTMVADNAQPRVISELYFAACSEEKTLPRLGQITAPTLVIHGDRDHAEIIAVAGRLATDIPGARSETVLGADHYLPLRTPAELTELLLAHPLIRSGA
jgi:3-oxoadipate enol-lactonase